jgi:hypothetical protein
VITDGDQLAWLAAAFARAFCIVTVIKANKWAWEPDVENEDTVGPLWGPGAVRWSGCGISERVLGYLLVSWLKLVRLKVVSVTYAWIQILKRLKVVNEH